MQREREAVAAKMREKQAAGKGRPSHHHEEQMNEKEHTGYSNACVSLCTADAKKAAEAAAAAKK